MRYLILGEGAIIGNYSINNVQYAGNYSSLIEPAASTVRGNACGRGMVDGIKKTKVSGIRTPEAILKGLFGWRVKESAKNNIGLPWNSI